MTPMRIVACLIAAMSVAGIARAHDMRFDIMYMNHTSVIVADGSINESTPAEFQQFMDQTSIEGYTIWFDLNSAGGDFVGAMELGRLVREHKFTTRVVAYRPRLPGERPWLAREQPGTCIGACALAFLGGFDREVMEGAVLGFQRVDVADAPARKGANRHRAEVVTQAVAQRVAGYIQEMGVSPTLLTRMNQTPPGDAFVPNAKERAALGVTPPDGFSQFALEAYGSGAIAYAIFEGNLTGRNIISEVSVYCRRGVPYVLLSQPPGSRGSSRDWVDGAYQMLGGVSVSPSTGGAGVTFPPSNVDLRVGSRAIAELRLDTRARDMLMEGADIWVDLPTVMGPNIGAALRPTHDDAGILREALRRCIE